jgi:ADP-ribose pyrophosphatase YjhB (NUDIX family)
MPDFIRRTPTGEDRERRICGTCGFVDYENPRIIVGSVIAHHGQVLLCRRAIEPRYGFWTLPAGFLELGETIEDGARREAWEEARVRILLDGVLGLYSISRIGQVQVIFRGRFLGAPSYEAGPESLDVRLFDWADIPWDDIAFPSVHWSLQAWQAAADAPLGAPARNPAEDARGTRPLD